MISLIGRKPNSQGHTLIELILLTIIIAILVAISTPLFRKTFSNLEFRNASFNIARLIRFAQEKAIAERLPHKLILETDKARYYLTKSDPKRPDRYIRLEERAGRVFSLPRGVRLKSDKKEIIFYPDGHSDKAVIGFLSKDKALNISIKGSLGHVEIKDSPK